MKDPLFGNKIAAAILTTLLLAFGLPIVITTLTKVFSHHGHGEFDPENPFHLAYIPAQVDIGPAEPGNAPAEVADLGTLLAAADVSRGERASGLCGSCHSFDEGGANGIGPNLWNIVGRQVAGVSGFGYSSALQGFGGEWSYDRLDAYLENSQEYVPGTQMAQKINKPAKRADILAYLGSLSNDPVPFPEPAAPAEEEQAASETAEQAGGL